MAASAISTPPKIIDFDISELEKPYDEKFELLDPADKDKGPDFTKPLATNTNTNALGMMYRSTANVSIRAKELGNYLKDLTDGKGTSSTDGKLEVDNPLVLARITAASGNYNMARQLQSNLMKAIKDTAQAIGRNV